MYSLMLVIALLCGSSSCFAEKTSFQQKVDAYLIEKNFQGAIFIGKQGKVLFSKGYGFANREHGIFNTPQTVFRLGSITKEFTAVAILQLQDQGLLNVNDPIAKHLPEYPNGAQITIHELLTHSAGIPSITKLPNLSQIQLNPLTPTQALSHFKDLPLEFTPGSDCKYSDSGYIVLGAIIEKVAKMPYENYVKEHIFLPLGMHASFFDHHQSIIPRRASGYRMGADGAIQHAEFIDMTFPHAAGALASTVEDMYLFDRALKEGTLLSSQTAMLPFQVHASSKKNRITYGYGFYIDLEQHAVGHKGSIEGFRATSYRYLDDDMTIILLSNQESLKVDTLRQEIAALLFSSWR